MDESVIFFSCLVREYRMTPPLTTPKPPEGGLLLPAGGKNRKA